MGEKNKREEEAPPGATEYENADGDDGIHRAERSRYVDWFSALREYKEIYEKIIPEIIFNLWPALKH